MQYCNKSLIENNNEILQYFNKKNSKVFEQKGDLLNFKTNIDPRAVVSQVKPGQAQLSQSELS